MRLLVFGDNARMQGAAEQARRAGWEVLTLCDEKDVPQDVPRADAALLPWPHSFRGERLTGGTLDRARVLGLAAACRVAACGSGVEAAELPPACRFFSPAQDEKFLRVNAQLTAEGAIDRAMQRPGRALLGSTCVVTGFGRIGQALTERLTALGAFVIVCARSEAQMQRAHEMGAHPVPLAQIASACAQADLVFNTVPARILGETALAALGRDAMVIELASAPYGLDVQRAEQMGVLVAVEGGVPGRYAPLAAGAALFDALQRAVMAHKDENGGGCENG